MERAAEEISLYAGTADGRSVAASVAGLGDRALQFSLFLCVGVIAALLYVVRARFSIYSYPWYFPDSYDWLVNGLAYTGLEEPLDISHRTMLLPLFVAILERIGRLDLAVLYGLGAYVLSVLAAFYGTLSVFGFRLALVTTALYAASYVLLAQSAFLGSDVMANALLSASALSYLAYLSRGSGRGVVCSAVFMGLCIHSQYIGAIFLPFMLISSCVTVRGRLLAFETTALRHLLLRSAFWAGSALALLVALGFLVPRLAAYGIIYTEKVEHGSLVRLYREGMRYYATGFLAVFTWPLVLLCAAGIWTRFRAATRLEDCYMLGWLLWITGFFALLYTWMDIRFLIYVSVPFFYFAAHGLLAALAAIPGPLPVRVAVAPLLSLGVFYFDMSRGHVSPWEREIAITPRLSYAMFPHHRMVEREMLPYPILHWREGREISERIAREDVDSLGFSEPALRLMKRLPADSPAPIWFYSPLAPNEHYIVKNRNILYRGARVDTTSSLGALLEAMRRNRILLVAKRPDLAALEPTLSAMGFTPAETIAEEAPYAAVMTGNNDPSRALASSETASLVSSVSGAELSENLFNGVSDLPTDWAAAPLGKPIEVTLKEPVRAREAFVHLFDHDSRFYRITVEARIGGAWQELMRSPESGTRGVAIVEVNATIDALRITGTYNSNMETNPANAILHVKEIVLTAED